MHGKIETRLKKYVILHIIFSFFAPDETIIGEMYPKKPIANSCYSTYQGYYFFLGGKWIHFQFRMNDVAPIARLHI